MCCFWLLVWGVDFVVGGDSWLHGCLVVGHWVVVGTEGRFWVGCGLVVGWCLVVVVLGSV